MEVHVMTECSLCVAIQSVAETDLVREAVTKKELNIETMLTGMRDAVLLGWALRDMKTERATAESMLCEEHCNQIKALTSEEEGSAA
jgi:hypothetical protein